MTYRRAAIRPRAALGRINIRDQEYKAKELLVILHSDIRLIFIDEYIVNETQAKRYRWMKKGVSDPVYHQQRQTSFSVICAIDKQGLLHLHVQQNTIKGDNISSFIRALKDPFKKKKVPLIIRKLFYSGIMPEFITLEIPRLLLLKPVSNA